MRMEWFVALFFFFNKLAAITSRKVTDRKNALNKSVGLVAFLK